MAPPMPCERPRCFPRQTPQFNTPFLLASLISPSHTSIFKPMMSLSHHYTLPHQAPADPQPRSSSSSQTSRQTQTHPPTAPILQYRQSQSPQSHQGTAQSRPKSETHSTARSSSTKQKSSARSALRRWRAARGRRARFCTSCEGGFVS